MARRPVAEGREPLPRDGRERLCLPGAARPDGRRALARACPPVRDARRGPSGAEPLGQRARPLHALDRRPRLCAVPRRLHRRPRWAAPPVEPVSRPPACSSRRPGRESTFDCGQSSGLPEGSAVNTTKRAIWAFALAGCLGLMASAAGSSAPAPLLIAVEGPQSGEQAPSGLDQVRGVRLAVAQLNARGGLWDGRRVAVYAADDKGESSLAKGLARQVIAKGIGFVIGPYNSSVGLANLALYRRNHVLPLWLTSRDETAGAGATVQAMNTQIAPVEERYAKGIGARRIAMLVDDTANGAFTKGMANRLRRALVRDGASVTWISLEETTAKGLPD